jgi:phage shock protein A
MQHSNRQKLEQKYKEQLETEKMSDRELFELKKDMAEYKEDKLKQAKGRARRNVVRFYCASVFFAFFVAAIGLIIYFYCQVKDTIISEYLKQKQTMPQTVEQVQNTIADAQTKYEQAKKAYEEAKTVYEQLKKAKNASAEKINQAKAVLDQAEEFFNKAAAALK